MNAKGERNSVNNASKDEAVRIASKDVLWKMHTQMFLKEVQQKQPLRNEGMKQNVSLGDATKNITTIHL
jgi:hypothetical protein